MRGPYGKLWTEFFLPFRAWAMKQGKKKQGSITCRTDRVNEANKMFIIWLCWLFRFWKGDRELEVRTATYGPGTDQSQHAKSVSHIINIYTNIHSYIHRSKHTDRQTYIVHIYRQIERQKNTHSHTYIHTYIHHTYTHTYIHTYTHT